MYLHAWLSTITTASHTFRNENASLIQPTMMRILPKKTLPHTSQQIWDESCGTCEIIVPLQHSIYGQYCANSTLNTNIKRFGGRSTELFHHPHQKIKNDNLLQDAGPHRFSKSVEISIETLFLEFCLWFF